MRCARENHVALAFRKSSDPVDSLLRRVRQCKLATLRSALSSSARADFFLKHRMFPPLRMLAPAHHRA